MKFRIEFIMVEKSNKKKRHSAKRPRCSGVSSGGGEIRETKRTNDSQVPRGSGLLSKLLQRSSVE